MANGTIAFDTLSTSGQISGTAKSLDTDYVVSGSAKSWVNFTGITTTAARDSFNVGSFTDVGTGKTNITYTSAMANNDYSGSYYTSSSEGTAAYDFANAFGGAFGINEHRTTALIKVAAYTASAFADSIQNDVIIHGDLA